MLLASWAVYIILKGFRSFNAENVGSVGQRAANLPAIKVWEWFDPGPPRTRADWFECGRGRMADFFVRPPTLTTSNFEAIWLKDFKFSAIKDLNRLKKYAKYQKASSILRVGFAFSKYPYFNRAYLVSSGFGCPHLYTSFESPDVWLFGLWMSRAWIFVYRVSFPSKLLSSCLLNSQIVDLFWA